MPNNRVVIDTKPSNTLVLDTKPKMVVVAGETVVYTEERYLLLGMPIPFAGAFHLTYPVQGTITGQRS